MGLSDSGFRHFGVQAFWGVSSQGLGFAIQGLGCKVWGVLGLCDSGFRVSVFLGLHDSGLRLYDSGYRA